MAKQPKDKVRINHLLEGTNMVEKTIKDVVVKLKDENLQEKLQVTDLQWEKVEKKLIENVTNEIHEKMFEALKDAEYTIDFPTIGAIYSYTSGYKSKDGSHRRKLKANTYKDMRKALN